MESTGPLPNSSALVPGAFSKHPHPWRKAREHQQPRLVVILRRYAHSLAQNPLQRINLGITSDFRLTSYV